MLRPKNPGAVPPGGICRYKDPDAGFIVSHPYYDQVKAQAKDGRNKRGLQIPFNWDAFFDEQFCKATPTACVEVPDAPVETSPNWAQLAISFGTSIFRWVASGGGVVPWETFKQRYRQCTGDADLPRCPKFTTFRGTGITKCGSCGCSSLKLWLPSERCPIGKW